MKFSFFKLIYLILLKPQVFTYLRTHGWWQALRPLLVLIVISSTLLGYQDWQETEQATIDWSNWLFDTQIDSLEIGANKLIYKTKKPLPYTASHNGTRFHFTEDGKKYKPQKSDLAEGSNLWVSASKVEHIVKSNGKTGDMSFYNEGKLLPVYPLEAMATKLTPQKSVTKATLIEYLNSQFRPYFYAMCLFIVLGTVLIGSTLLAFMQLILRSPVFKGMTASQVIGTYYYCAIPGIIIATFYDLLPLDSELLNFSQVFIFSMFFYLLFFAGPNIRSTAQIAKDFEENEK